MTRTGIESQSPGPLVAIGLISREFANILGDDGSIKDSKNGT